MAKWLTTCDDPSNMAGVVVLLLLLILLLSSPDKFVTCVMCRAVLAFCQQNNYFGWKVAGESSGRSLI